MSGKPVTRGKILAFMEEKGVAIPSKDLVWDSAQECYTIGGMDWFDWLDDMTMG